MQNAVKNAGSPAALNLEKTLSLLTSAQRSRIMEAYDVKSLEKVFLNEGLMAAVNAYLDNQMNVSLTARALYMHRNTLIYRLNAVKKLTGFDLGDFKMAVTFKILHIIYMLEKEQN